MAQEGSPSAGCTCGQLIVVIAIISALPGPHSAGTSWDVGMRNKPHAALGPRDRRTRGATPQARVERRGHETRALGDL
jgi:hypothetical protein